MKHASIYLGLLTGAFLFGVQMYLTRSQDSFALLVVTPSHDVSVMDFDMTIDDCVAGMLAFADYVHDNGARIVCEIQPLNLERITPPQN